MIFMKPVEIGFVTASNWFIVIFGVAVLTLILSISGIASERERNFFPNYRIYYFDGVYRVLDYFLPVDINRRDVINK